MDEAAIRIRTGIPENEKHYNMPDHSWLYTVYDKATEEVDPKDPEPKGHVVRTTTFVDANLQHCKITGKSATGILYCLNQINTC